MPVSNRPTRSDRSEICSSRCLKCRAICASSTKTGPAKEPGLKLIESGPAVKAPAAFARRDLDEARQLHGQAKLNGARDVAILLKLADAHFLLGDLAAEKALRETFYGSLDPR